MPPKRSTKQLTGTRLPKVATENYPPTHPIFKRILGNMLLASAHPNGFNEGLREQTFYEMMTRTYNWLNKRPGRAVNATNNGQDIIFTFLEDGKECEGVL
jgi:hypothetical protein